MAVYRNRLTEPIYGLVPALRQLDRLNPPPAVGGGDWRKARSVSMDGGACGEGEILDPCDVETTKGFRDSAAPVTNVTHILQDSWTCDSDIGPAGFDFAAVEAEAVENMRQSTTALFERMTYNDYFSACVAPNAGTPLSLTAAISAVLADAIAAGLRRVMIHVPSAVYPVMQGAAVFDSTGVLYRVLNHVIVYGDGYPQPVAGVFNIFGSSLPYGWVDDPYVLGQNMRDVFDTANNELVAITEQPAAVLIDDCFTACYESTIYPIVVE